MLRSVHCPATPRDGPTLAPSVCPAVAVLAGHVDIPQISYWSTSSALDDTTTYPRFMRTIPTGLPLWSSIPQLAQTNLLSLRLAVLPVLMCYSHVCATLDTPRGWHLQTRRSRTRCASSSRAR